MTKFMGQKVNIQAVTQRNTKNFKRATKQAEKLKSREMKEG